MRYIFVVLVLVPNSLCAQTAREIINRYLDTVSHHDIRNWDKITSAYMENVSYYSQNDFEHKMDLMHADKPSFNKTYKVYPYTSKIVSYDDSTFSSVTSTFYFLKDKIIMDIGNIPRMEKEAAPRGEFYSDHFPVMLSKIVAKSKSIELMGTKQFMMSNGLFYEIKVRTKGNDYLLYINTETFLLEYWNGRDDGDQSILSRLYDYKQVGEFLMPMSDCLMRHGVVYFWNHIRKIELDVAIDPKEFDYKK